MSSTPHTDTDTDDTSTITDASRTTPDPPAIVRDAIDTAKPWHDFMRSRPGTQYDPVSVAATLQERVADLPASKATFRLVDILGDADMQPSAVKKPRLVELTGAWPAPEPLVAGKRQRWVNPNHPHARYYSEVMTECACGAVMVLERPDNPDVTQGEHDHADDCPADDRLRARARLAANRRDTLCRVLHLGHSARESRDRLGQTRDTLSNVADRLCVDIGAHKAAGRRQCARTWARLLTDHTPRAVGAAYGHGRSAICKTVNEYTDTTAGDLYAYRQQEGHQ